MPIQSHHHEYDAATVKWKRARDASTGQDAVHAAGEAYLPKLGGQLPAAYEAMKLRTSYFNATGRVIDALVGLVFRKPMAVEQSGLDAILKDLDLNDTNIDSFAQIILRETLKVSRIAALVEYPQVKQTVLTQAEQVAYNLRPYATLYKSESIINWRKERINNVMQYTLVTLSECDYDRSDPYSPKEIPQLRELLLENGVYIQRIWQKPSQSKDWLQIGGDIIPLLNGAPLFYIPLFPFGANENELTIYDAPILPLADLNLAHYRVTADYEHGCHLSGLPTMLIAGVMLGDNEKIHVGSSIAITSPDAQAHGEYIEVNGNFGALENNLERKQKQMAVLASRVLEAQVNTAQAADTIKQRSNGENSVLAAMANLISAQLSKMLSFMALWNGTPQLVSIKLSTDFAPEALTAQKLTALVSAYQSGAISEQVLFDNLKAGEIISEATTFDEEQQAKQDNPVALAV